jgi:hypothetical protein
VVENPYQEGSRSHQVFDVLVHADRPLRSAEVAATVGESDVMVVHSVVKGLRAKGVHVYRYRDPDSGNGSASLYSLQAVAGLTELAAGRSRQSRPRPSSNGPPAPMVPKVRQPLVGAPVRVTGVWLEGEELFARFDCDGVAYRGVSAKSQPAVGEWLTLVAVGLHGRGLYVDLAGARTVTLEDIAEVNDGDG